MIKVSFGNMHSCDEPILERLLAGCLWTLFVGAMGGLLFLIAGVVNSAGLSPVKSAVTAVSLKETIPAHTSIMLMLVGDVQVQIPTFYDEAYVLHFEICDQEVSTAVNKSVYDTVLPGELIDVEYGFGLLTGSCHVVNVSRP